MFGLKIPSWVSLVLGVVDRLIGGNDMESSNRVFLALGSLGLSSEEFAALAKQGRLRAEDCGHGHVYYRLRFRMGPRQCVRYVGNSTWFVDQVRGELTELQAKTRSRCQLRQLVREAKGRLRDVKCRLEPLLPSVGRVFHGRELRQPRRGGYASNWMGSRSWWAGAGRDAIPGFPGWWRR
jgi:hypothetical protein